MEIIMPRGDLRPVRFTVTDGETAPELTQIYATFKKSFSYPNFLFQKKLSDGSIEALGDGSYQFTIEPEDTNGLTYGAYAFDIELVGDGIKQTFTGTLTLTNEATHAGNEG